MSKIELEKNIVWDLIRKKQQVDAIKGWVIENKAELKTLGLLESINRILYTGGSEEEM